MAKPMKLSYKKMQELHKMLGGNAKGYFITTYGSDVNSGVSISIEERIAVNVRPNASADNYLVKGRPHKAYNR